MRLLVDLRAHGMGVVILTALSALLVPASAARAGETVTRDRDRAAPARPMTATETTMDVSLAPQDLAYGGRMVVAARVTGAGTAAPQGQVAVYLGETLLGRASLVDRSGGTLPHADALLRTEVPRPGTYDLHVVYEGSADHRRSQAVLTGIPVARGTSGIVPLMRSQALPGEAVTLSAKVSKPPLASWPQGSVTFSVGDTVLGTAPLEGEGHASLITRELPFAVNAVTTHYSGSADLMPSTASRTINVSLNAGPEALVAVGGSEPAVAPLGTGAVIAYLVPRAGPGQRAVEARILAPDAQFVAPDGRPVGPAIMVAPPQAGISGPKVAGLANGDFVVVWQAPARSGSPDILMRRFAANGEARAPASVVNTVTAGVQAAPAIAALAGGGFVIAWQSSGIDGSGSGIAQRRFSATGRPLGPQVTVNQLAAGDQLAAVIAGSPTGGWAVGFNTRNRAGFRPFVRVFAAGGKAISGDVAIDTAAMPALAGLAVTALTKGSFAVAWDRPETPGSAYPRDVHSLILTADGEPIDQGTIAHAPASGHQFAPRIAAIPTGRFLVGWTSHDDDATGVAAQAFNAGGMPDFAPFALNETATGSQRRLALAPVGDGSRVLAVWSTSGQDRALDAIHARLVAAP